jgi:hypothetical protein
MIRSSHKRIAALVTANARLDDPPDNSVLNPSLSVDDRGQSAQ